MALVEIFFFFVGLFYLMWNFGRKILKRLISSIVPDDVASKRNASVSQLGSVPQQGPDSLPYSSANPYASQQGPAPISGYEGYARNVPSHPLASSQPRRPRLDRKYSKIADQFNSLEEITDALARAGLESSNLIVGIDFTKSNEWTGKYSFNGRSLHHIGDTENPYEQALSIIGPTLSSFDEDNLIPCFGFGDASTHDQDVFSFYPDGSPCNGFKEALSRYREIIPHLILSGPTSFAPIIEMAMTIVEQKGGQYHVLLIIADGQVTRSVDTNDGQLSPQEQRTVEAIVRASDFPLSIILVGVGDGPWDTMKEFDDNIPDRSFDNFQFVNFTAIMSKNVSLDKKEREFAVAALMEIPLQYRATIELGILGRQAGGSPERFPLPPPYATYRPMPSTSAAHTPVPLESPKLGQTVIADPTLSSSSTLVPNSTVNTPVTVLFHRDGTVTVSPSVNTTAPNSSSSSSLPGAQVCEICFVGQRVMAFGCGHMTCSECAEQLTECPFCRKPIDVKIRTF